jgi:hypothetical protein
MSAGLDTQAIGLAVRTSGAEAFMIFVVDQVA